MQNKFNQQLTQLTKEEFLDRFIFYRLINLNDGFDAASIKYFSANDFEIVLNRAKEFGIEILGIEPWKDGAFYDAATFEDTGMAAANPSWYFTAFEKFKEKDSNLQYAGSYDVLPHLLIRQ
jgi:hypothetical protein